MNLTNEATLPRTDLAIEQLKHINDNNLSGVTEEHFSQDNVKITKITITDENTANSLKKSCGTYITIEPTKFSNTPLYFENEIEVIANQINSLLPKNVKSALVVGLGNKDITPDALGSKAISYCLITNHLPHNLKQSLGLSDLLPVCAIAPGVLGQTGIESSDIVKSLCNDLKPDVVLIIDALASKSVERLGTTLQISNSGISPGSGVLNSRKELSHKTLNTNVISIGVPTVVDLQTIVSDFSVRSHLPVPYMMVTPREIDLLIEHASKVIGFSITKALQPNLSIEEISGLVS